MELMPAPATTADGERGQGGFLERRGMAEAPESRQESALLSVVELASRALETGIGFPNADLAGALVENVFSGGDVQTTAALWKLLGRALASRFVSSLHVLALLTPRILPHRRAQPEAYRMYLELMARHFMTISSLEPGPCRDEIIKRVDCVLQLSQTYGVHLMDFGHVIVLFVFHVIIHLIDCALEDSGLPFVSTKKHPYSSGADGPRPMSIDFKGSSNEKKSEHRENLRRTNNFMSFEVVEKMAADDRIQVFLRLVHLNMHEAFSLLRQRLEFLEANKLALKSLVPTTCNIDEILSNIHKAMDLDHRFYKPRQHGYLVNYGSPGVLLSYITGAGSAACWISFDIYMENTMDGKHLSPVPVNTVLTDIIRTQQSINQASWHETFKALWISALRLVHRDMKFLEGPLPQLDARLCMLLAIVPISISTLLKEESELMSGVQGTNHTSFRRQGLISSLQALGQLGGLLLPPSSVATAANVAAMKAASYVNDVKAGSSNLTNINRNDSHTKAVGSMLHLIVEACIARNLIDTSAYFWPGYIVLGPPSKDSAPIQESQWLNFMQGAPLTSTIKNSLMMTPASSVAELEKLYHIALNGTEEERCVASKILCGASLVRGWNIQEHVVQMVIKLLCPLPTDSSSFGSDSHYIAHMPMLNTVLFGISCVDTIHILSLYGMIPDLAAALMPLCEAFGSMPPQSNHKLTNPDETSVYSIFSCAFLCLLRLWKFYRAPHEHTLAGRGCSVKMELNLDYFLQMRNLRISLQCVPAADRASNNAATTANSSSSTHDSLNQTVYFDTFPKLRAWHFQNQACIASTQSGLCNKNSVLQTGNKILSMIFRKMNKGGECENSSSTTPTSSCTSTASPSSVSDDAYQRPAIPAWEVLEAIPCVLETILAACAHEKLSSRDLTTGLRDLVDFLPASLAAIITYFSAEITRGIWKLVPMNGSDWPSPAANLHSIESEIKDILASAGVQVKSFYPRGMPPMLPLPMAALVSLTITFKLEKSLEYIHGVVGQALENCAEASSWPSMPIIGALWTQKVRRWHDFIVLSCTRSPFSRDKDAVAQLIRSCFVSFLGSTVSGGSYIDGNRGVTGLLGLSAVGDQKTRISVEPGFLYLRTCRTFHDTHFVSEVIFKLVVEWARKLSNEWASGGPYHLKSGRTSLAAAACAVYQAAILGASLLCIAGGMLLIQVLYEETFPKVLLSIQEEKPSAAGPALSVLEGYAMASVMIFSSSFIWGGRSYFPDPTGGSFHASRRSRVITGHMDFLATILDGNLVLACNPTTWKAYVSCFVGLLVKLQPSWVSEVKLETLCKLAGVLSSWGEPDLAFSLLECGGPAAIGAIVDSFPIAATHFS